MAIRFTGIASGLDTETLITELMKAERMKVDSLVKKQTTLEWKNEAWKELNQKLYSFYTKQAFNLRAVSTYNKKIANVSDSNKVTVNAANTAVSGVHTLEILSLSRSASLTGDALTEETVTLNTTLADLGINNEEKLTISAGAADTEITLDSSWTISQLIDKIKEKDANLNVSFDTNYKRFYISNKEAGADSAITIGGDAEALTALGLTAGVTNGENAKFVYNGVTYESSKNEAQVNGLSFSFKDVTTSVLTISVNQDTQAIYDSVKDFVTEYNKLVEELGTKYYAASTRGYEPLTADEKSAMSESDIKLWEEKVKSSLLRRDTIISSLTNSMRSILTLTKISDNGDYSMLSDLGIGTGKYIVGMPETAGKLFINGDSEDLEINGKENKLMAAIEADPEAVSKLLTSIGDELYKDLQDKMATTSSNRELKSALTFYNDKQISKQIDDYKKKIEDMEERLILIENRYYAQFTAMEKALQNANSQSSYFTALLNGGN